MIETNKIVNTDKALNTLPTSQDKRLSNLILDNIAYWVIFFIILFQLGFLELLQSLQLDEISIGILIYLPYLVYYIVMESIWGKTIGKFITKTKVVMKNGTKPSVGTIIVRSLFRLIPFDILSFLGSTNPIGWHDRFSKTIVVDDLEE